MAYLTVNHGETLYDNALLNLLTDAGYRYTYLDLMNFEIPEDCELLVTYNPAKDFAVNDGISVKPHDGLGHILFGIHLTEQHGPIPCAAADLAEIGFEGRHE